MTPSPEQHELQPSFDDVDELNRKITFYSKRMDMLQCWQSSMRDPERKIVCDILANGFTLTPKEAIDNANAAIAAQAREKVLEKLYPLHKYADDEYNEANLSDNEREMMIHLEYSNRIWGLMKSLRTGGDE